MSNAAKQFAIGDFSYRVKAVSYTHLDVYKRQVQQLLCGLVSRLQSVVSATVFQLSFLGLTEQEGPINHLMLVEIGIHQSAPKDIKLQLSVEKLDICIRWQIILVHSPSRAVLSHRKSPLWISPALGINGIIGMNMRKIISIHGFSAPS